MSEGGAAYVRERVAVAVRRARPADAGFTHLGGVDLLNEFRQRRGVFVCEVAKYQADTVVALLGYTSQLFPTTH
jgi:hypothetical protein